MFAKVFGQIFDSSIAEDYNCRRMFMDLLILADSTGAVDMTAEAISRRTNVPLPEVEKYLEELSRPDPLSRSKKNDGKRIVPLDSGRNWGWLIVNYGHYRKIRDEEVRRTYFRDAQRKYRASKKPVKDKGLTSFDKVGQVLTSPSASSSKSESSSGTDAEFIARLTKDKKYAQINVKQEHDKMLKWYKAKEKIPTRAGFINWLARADRPLEQSKQKRAKELPFSPL